MSDSTGQETGQPKTPNWVHYYPLWVFMTMIRLPDTGHASRKNCAPRLVTFLLLAFSLTVQAGPLDETRYCGEPKRNAKGEIVRRADVLAAFKKIHPCPATGLSAGSCPGWQMDHIVPLVCGGCDAVSNLQWLPVELKTCKGTCKDRWEQRVYCAN